MASVAAGEMEQRSRWVQQIPVFALRQFLNELLGEPDGAGSSVSVSMKCSAVRRAI